MSIRDDDPPYAPRRAPSPRRGPAERQRQIMARRAIAVVVGVIVLILIVIGVRGCLDARKTRSFENFVADLRSLVAQTDQLSKGFFQHLESPQGSKLTFQTQLRTDAGTAGSLLTRAEQLSTPGELNAAHSDLNLAYQFRSNALTGIANELAGAKPSRKTADHVVAYMKQLVASDVIYERSETEIDQGLSDQGIAEKAPASVFIPDYQKWLDPTKVGSILAGIGVSSGGGNVSGVHGTGIAGATLNGSALTPGLATTVTSAAPNAIAISIQNQGQATERDIEVSVKVSGGGANITKRKTVPSIAAGSTGTATVDLGSPPTGSPLTIKVSVAPVVGERITTNNHETYNVTFQ